MKRSIFKKYLGQPIIVSFYDHAQGDEAILCKAIGWLAKEDDIFIILCSWDLPNIEDINTRKINMELVSIIKSAITCVESLGKSKCFFKK